METGRHHASSRKLVRIAQKLKDKLYRDSFVAARARRFLAHQVRAIRGTMSQSEFGKLIDKPQSVVSRLEDPAYGKMTINSLLDIAAKIDRAVVIQFIDWRRFLKMTEDDSEASSASMPYDAEDIEAFAAHEASASPTLDKSERIFTSFNVAEPATAISSMINPANLYASEAYFGGPTWGSVLSAIPLSIGNLPTSLAISPVGSVSSYTSAEQNRLSLLEMKNAQLQAELRRSQIEKSHLLNENKTLKLNIPSYRPNIGHLSSGLPFPFENIPALRSRQNETPILS